MAYVRKIINDPVYGFITVDDPLIFEIISHPYYQRLRRIHQMAFASMVYPGAVHTRLHHSLGAYHLMGLALNELRNKGTEITEEEERGAKIAILLHDIGHGPYSHALERRLIKGVHHEDISRLILQLLNEQFNGRLQTAIDIFTGNYPKTFLHQLVSGQLDVDRLDYLNRDSFFTGVIEGAVGYIIRYERGTFQSGFCILEDRKVVVLNKFLQLEGRINTLIELLPQLKIDADALTPESRKVYDDVMARFHADKSTEGEAPSEEQS